MVGTKFCSPTAIGRWVTASKFLAPPKTRLKKQRAEPDGRTKRGKARCKARWASHKAGGGGSKAQGKQEDEVEEREEEGAEKMKVWGSRTSSGDAVVGKEEMEVERAAAAAAARKKIRRRRPRGREAHDLR